ncbi:hypothetical protein [Pseudonocardia humida]|uniref:DUF1579 domain-containing protein n=1 Tax=Pseudonocardia humida TaxID=2800819 RepID=A0ABT1A1L9_9PSEU|nr:hypothetical protein [Pseudonocardia humida]MCO1656789.1 hypothetical protein [Pseudonocardia humida]
MTTSPVPPVGDGRADFDFLHGSWRIAARRLSDVFDPASPWVDFDLTAEVRPVLAGLGNHEVCHGPTGPSGGPFDGMTLRLFDPRTRTWRIWWASTGDPGHLDPPLEGRFDGTRGDFHGRDRVAGTDVDVHFRWDDGGGDAASWAQAFSTDGARTWVTNFTMDFRRG